ncbi:MAG: AraC family transcriptional regulator [Gemmatimonadales bacterium]
MSPSAAAGQICVWNSGSLWIGRASAPNDVHSHHAVQVALALEGQFRFQSPVDGVWLDCTGAVISSNHPHAFDGRNAPTLAHLFVEPQSLPGRVLLQRFPATHGICLLNGPLLETAAQSLSACYRASREGADLIRTAREVIRMLTDGVEVPAPADSRILLALDYLRDNLSGTVSLERVAAEVHLSPSRFRHLFVREMGLAFRPYVLWLRVNRAVEAFAAGESLTTAAYHAGFADSAHLSRTFRRMYGMAAGTLHLE